MQTAALRKERAIWLVHIRTSLPKKAVSRTAWKISQGMAPMMPPQKNVHEATKRKKKTILAMANLLG
jgi:hypothetical protein